MKTRRSDLKTLFILVLLSVLFIGLNPYPADADSEINLKFSTWHPPAGREVKTVWIPMLEELKKRSNGRITYTLYAGGALGKGPEHFDIVKNGLSDMGYFTATWTPGRFPMADILSLATPVKGKDTAARIGNSMLEQNPAIQKEFQGVKVLELNGCISAYLWTKKPVRSLADCKGLKIRSPGGFQTNYIKALGAEPVFMPLGDVYLALETGTIDGLVTCPPLVLAFKLHEVAKYGVISTFGCVTEGVVMNQKSWDKMAPDLQKIVTEVVSNPFHTTHGLNNDVYAQMMKDIAAKGVDLYELPDEEQTKWFEGFTTVTETWIKDMTAKGLPAEDAVKLYSRVVKGEGLTCDVIPPALQE